MRYNPKDYFVSSEYTEEICIVDEFQRRGTTFPLNIEVKNRKQKFFALLDTGAKIRQCFIICRELRRNIILGVDFAKQNCAGIQWTTNRMRILSLNGIKAVEVEEDELGIPVTASCHVRIPPRHNAVFEVNIHAELQGTQVITGNQHLLEKHPNIYQHEIAIKSEKNNETFPLMAITNLDQVKTLHLHKGEVVGFARTESTEVTYIATTNKLNIEETIDVIPRNWIPQWKWNLKSQALNRVQATFSECSKSSLKSRRNSEESNLQMQKDRQNDENQTNQEQIREFPEHSQDSHQETTTNKFHASQCNSASATTKSKVTEHSRNSMDQ